MLWSNFDIELAKEERDCDVLLTDERDGVDVYEAWECADDEDTLVLEDAAPEPVYDYACEQKGWGEVLWASEAERAKVKFAVQEVKEETRFYLEEPPSNVYVDVGRLEAMEILERRGIEVTNYDDAWYYPRKNKAVFMFVSSDSHGETYRTLREIANLDETERKLVNGEWPDDEELEETPLAVLQERIYENSDFGELKSGVIACWKKGIRENAEIAEQLDIDSSAASTTVYQITQKLEKRRWEQEYVYAHVPEEKRPDDLLFADGAGDGGNR